VVATDNTLDDGDLLALEAAREAAQWIPQVAPSQVTPGADQPDISLPSGRALAPESQEAQDAATADYQLRQEQAQMQAQADAITRASMTQGASQAGWEWRLPIGAAADSDQALQWLKTWAPDAQPLPGVDRNFVFTDPKSDKRLVYRDTESSFPDLGDLASIVTDLAGAGGAIAGAPAGAALGALAGGFMAAPGAIAGAGIGGASAQEAARAAVRKAYGLPETRTLGQQALAAAGDAATFGAAEGVGKPLISGALNEVGNVIARAGPAWTEAGQFSDPAVARNLQDSMTLGTGVPWARPFDAMAGQAPASPVPGQVQGAKDAVQGALDNLAGRSADAAPQPLGPPAPPPGPRVGGVAAPPMPIGADVSTAPVPTSQGSLVPTMRSAANSAVSAWNVARGALDDALGQALGDDTQVPVMDELTALRQQLLAARSAVGGSAGGPVDQAAADAQLAAVNADLAARGQPPIDAPQLQGARDAAVQDALSRTEKMIYDAQANGGNLPVGRLRAERTAVNDAIDWNGPNRVMGADVYNRRVAGALNDSLGQAAQDAGAAAQQAWNDYNGFISNWRASGALDRLGQLANTDDPAALMKLATDNSPQAAQTWQALRAYAPQQFAQLRGAVIQQMGTTATGDFSPAQFAKQWATMGARDQNGHSSLMRQALFESVPGSAPQLADSTLATDLDRLSTITNAMRESGRWVNHSNTAGALFALNAVGKVLTSLSQGNIGDAVGGGARLVGAGVLARAITSPATIRFLATFLNEAQRGAAGRVLGQGAALYGKDQVLGPIVRGLQQEMDAQPQP
jgi:hypothetical protein